MELVRQKTLTKNTIIQVDGQPFRQWYLRRFGVDLTKKGEDGRVDHQITMANKPDDVEEEEFQKVLTRAHTQSLEEDIEAQLTQGRLLCCISSRPGQIGAIDAYILEGEELA